MKSIINRLIRNKIKIKINESKRKKLLTHHFDSLNGNSGDRLRNFLLKNI